MGKVPFGTALNGYRSMSSLPRDRRINCSTVKLRLKHARRMIGRLEILPQREELALTLIEVTTHSDSYVYSVG